MFFLPFFVIFWWTDWASVAAHCVALYNTIENRWQNEHTVRPTHSALLRLLPLPRSRREAAFKYISGGSWGGGSELIPCWGLLCHLVKQYAPRQATDCLSNFYEVFFYTEKFRNFLVFIYTETSRMSCAHDRFVSCLGRLSLKNISFNIIQTIVFWCKICRPEQ